MKFWKNFFLPHSRTPKVGLEKSSHSDIYKIASYLEPKLKKMKTFEGTYIAAQAKKEIETYMQICAKDETTLHSLKIQNQEVAKEVQSLLQGQKIKGRGDGDVKYSKVTLIMN
jgi:biopolymer transport protein ExbD